MVALTKYFTEFTERTFMVVITKKIVKFRPATYINAHNDIIISCDYSACWSDKLNCCLKNWLVTLKNWKTDKLLYDSGNNYVVETTNISCWPKFN